MKPSIPISVSNPPLHHHRQQHVRSPDDMAGVLLTCLVGAPLLGAGVVVIIFILLGAGSP